MIDCKNAACAMPIFPPLELKNQSATIGPEIFERIIGDVICRSIPSVDVVNPVDSRCNEVVPSLLCSVFASTDLPLPGFPSTHKTPDSASFHLW